MSDKLKTPLATVEYIESGTFQGGEEEVYLAGIKRGEKCFVLKKEQYKYFAALREENARLKDKVINLQGALLRTGLFYQRGDEVFRVNPNQP